MTRPISLLTLLIVSLTLLTGCIGVTQEFSPPPGPAAGTQPQAPDQNELRSTILAAFQAQKGMSWRNQSDTVTADGNKGQTVIEFVPPDRYHITADGETELTVIGSQVYLKQGDVWTTSEIPVETIIDPEAPARLEKSITDIQALGSETLGGKPMQVYQYQSQIKVGESESPTQNKLWIGADDHLPYQLVTEGKVTALDPGTGQVRGVDATVTMQYAYDEGIQIADPGQ